MSNKKEEVYKISKIVGKYLILEIMTYHGYPIMAMEKLFKTSKTLRKLVINEFTIFNAVIPRETFKVNNITKLLSPFIKNYKLRI
jgi:hypothetical protein